MIQQFTELLWQESIQNLLMTEGWSEIPRVSCNPLPIPHGVSREVEVLVMSLMYKNNLLNSFLFRVDRAVSSPLCICGSEEQTALHLLSSCDLVDLDLKYQAKRIRAYFKTIECYGVTILPIFSEKCPRKQVHYWLNYVSKAFQTYDLHICQRK